MNAERKLTEEAWKHRALLKAVMVSMSETAKPGEGVYTHAEYDEAHEALDWYSRTLRAALAREQRKDAALRTIPPERLRLLADWLDNLDAIDGHSEGDEVQQDLRLLASRIQALAAVPVETQEAAEQTEATDG